MELLQKIITITFWLFEMFIWFTLRKSWVETWNTWTKHHRNIKKYNQTGYPCHLAFLSGLSFNIYLFLLSIILHIITFLLQNFSTSKTSSFILSKLRHLHVYAHYFNRWVLLWMHFIATRSRWPSSTMSIFPVLLVLSDQTGHLLNTVFW